MNKLTEKVASKVQVEYTGVGRRLPAAVAEKLMKEAAAEEYAKGGFGCKCEKCGNKYGQSYLVYVYLGSFREGYVCKECCKKFHLQKA